MIKLVVKTLQVGDVEDPEIYLGAVAYDWLQTEHGKYVKEKAKELTYLQAPISYDYGYQYYITAIFEDEEAVIYKLKWSDIK